MEGKKKYFHGVFEIDASGKEPNEAGKMVTDKTLITLREMLMEDIGYLCPDSKFIELLSQKRFLPLNEEIMSSSLGET